MEDHELIEQPQQSNTKVPMFLRVIGILSLINLGFSALTTFLALLVGPMPEQQLEEYVDVQMKQVDLMYEQHFDNMAATMEKTVNFIHYSNDHHYLMNAFNLAVVIFGVMGVVMMFRRQHLGFHFYIISCLLRLVAFYSIAPFNEVPMLLVGYYGFTSALFIFLYSRNIRYFKRTA